MRSPMQETTIQSLFVTFREELYAFILKRVEGDEVAKDILQNVFLKIQLHKDRLKDETKLTAWIYQITRNEINDYYRHARKKADIQIPDTVEVAHEENHNEAMARCVHPFIDQLPEKYREAILLTEIQGLSQVQLSEQLNLSYSGAKSRVQRAREKLVSLFSQCCEIHSDKYGNIVSYKQRDCKDCGCG